MAKRSKISLLFFLWTTFTFSQVHFSRGELRKNMQNCFELVKTDPEKALEIAMSVERQAHEINDWELELQSLVLQCLYFRGKNNFEKMMASANLLYKEAKNYKSDAYQIMARRYLFEAYIFSGLPDKAFRELEKGKELISKLTEND